MNNLNPRFQKPENTMTTHHPYHCGLTPVTDDRGRPLLHGEYAEPEPGSVLLVNGEFGMAWQRHFDDGLWHSTRPRDGKPRTWENMLTRRNVVLVYDAAVRT